MSGAITSNINTGVLSSTHITTGTIVGSNYSTSTDANDVLRNVIRNNALYGTRINKIEERLGIVQINTDLESRWSKLRVLGDEYRKLEAEIMEKEKIMEILKK